MLSLFSQNNLPHIISTNRLILINYFRNLSLCQIQRAEATEKLTTEVAEETNEQTDETPTTEQKEVDPKTLAKDRRKAIPVETSIRYLKSAAYQETYGNYLVWEQYRRNHKGLFPPRKTRKTCIRKGFLSTGNPCPICRDEYLVLHEQNIDLLKQFISKQSGQVLSYTKTGLCQNKHQRLLIAVERAMDCGLLTFDVPFREFDYSEYYKQN